MAEGEKSFIDKLKEDRGAALMALVALLLIIFGVFAVLGGAAVVTLNPPTNLRATVMNNDIKLTWDHSIDYPDPCMGYNAYLSTIAGQLGVLQNGEPVADNKYTIRDVSPGTYYATVRCTDVNGNEDGNLNQVEVKVEILPPSGLSIIINNGEEYTNKRDVTLALSATNAEECTNANEDMAWSAWGPYTVEKAWTLTENAGGVCEEKTVYYKCRNSGVESSAVSDTIILDTTKPSVSFNVLSIENNLVALQIFAQDDCDKNLDCHVFAGDQQVASIQNVAGEVTRTVRVPYGKFYLTVSCIDDALNTGTATLEIDAKAPKNITNDTTTISIKINDDAPTTTSLNVKLTLFARIKGEVPDACYYSSNEMGLVGPEPYTTSRSWTLDNTAPEHSRTYTVCYRCEKGNEDARACDSIRYVVEGEGDGDGGGGGGGGDENVPPRNLKIEIIGKRPFCIGSNCFIQILVPDREVTKWNEVDLDLSSSGATECKVWEEPPPGIIYIGDPEEMAPWSADLRNGIVAFSLSPKVELEMPDFQLKIVIVPDGLRTVHYKCRNDKGSTGPINDSIWYDATKPDPVSSLAGEYRTQLGEGDIGLPIINIKLTWAPAVDNSWEWAGYANKGVKLYTIERYYTLAGDFAKRVYTLDPEDYTPAQLGCAEGENWMALECTHTDFDLPPALTTQGGKMCYDISAWDYVGWQSDKETVCVDVPASEPIDENPYIEYAAIYTRGVIGIGDGGGEEILTSEQTIQPIDQQQTIFGTTTQTQVPLVLLAELGDRSPPPIPSGDMYTRTTAVWVDVMAENAEKCRLRNNGAQKTEWSSWMNYDGNPTRFTWTLLDIEGSRTVQVQCKNANGVESSIASDSIILDYTPPKHPLVTLLAQYIETCERNWIYFTWGGVFSDEISGIKSYTLKEYTKTLSGGGGGKGQPAPVWTETGSWTLPADQTSFYDYVFVKDATYKYNIIACDNAGNCNDVGVSTDEVTPTKNPYNVQCE